MGDQDGIHLGETRSREASADRDRWNHCRFIRRSKRGHYESYFQRANHPERPLAFWIRYTVFSPRGRPDDAVGELWAIHFDGERDEITAVKETVPISNCMFSEACLSARIGQALLDDAALEGQAASGGHDVQWSLRYAGDDPPLLLFPERLYKTGFPKAKVLVGTPNATYTGTLTVDGTRIDIDGWVGSQNHNWGSKHTDHYAWGQVAGFDDAPDAFLECSTARVKVGPVWTPWMTLVVLRVDGEGIALNTMTRALRARGRFEYFDWRFDTSRSGTRIRGRIHAPASSFVGLRYGNPPGGAKTCLNTKLAACELTLERPGRPPRTLTTQHRAAFEILTDDDAHGVPVVA